MRTTLTLDDDVAAMLKRVRRERKAGLKQAVNAALREGLPRMIESPANRPKFETPVLNLGQCLLPNLDNIAEVLETIEGVWYK
jgi:hypothetical protein